MKTKKAEETLRGWYIVTIPAMTDNNQKKFFSVTTLANNRMEAYNLAITHLEKNIPKNVTQFISFDSFSLAKFEFIGVWQNHSESIF